MQTELSRTEKNRVEIAVTVGVDEFEKALNRAAASLSSKVRLPGFRPGHAPRTVLERRLGKEALKEEALDSLVPQAFSTAVETHDLDPIDRPEVTDIVMEDGQPCTFKIKVEVMPEVKLGKYKGLSGVKVVAPVTDAREDARHQPLDERREGRVQECAAEGRRDGLEADRARPEEEVRERREPERVEEREREGEGREREGALEVELPVHEARGGALEDAEQRDLALHSYHRRKAQAFYCFT
jgi:hypothetical protein